MKKRQADEIRWRVHPKTGERWYYLADVCDAVGLDRRYQGRLLSGEDVWKDGPPRKTTISGRTILRLMLKTTDEGGYRLISRMLEEAAKDFVLIDEVIEYMESLKRQKAGERTNKVITIADVKGWLQLRDKGWRWTEIAAQAGHHSSVIQTYCTPKSAPEFIRQALFPTAS